MPVTLAYAIIRFVLAVVVLLVRGDVSKDAELLVLRRENAVLRRQVNRVRYEPADRMWLSTLAWLIPRRCWAQVFGVTPDTVLRWHRRLVSRRRDLSVPSVCRSAADQGIGHAVGGGQRQSGVGT